MHTPDGRGPEVEERTDEVLFSAYISGDQSAFTEIVKRHMPRMVAFFRKQFQDPGQVEDLCQETFFALHKTRESFDPARNLTQWLYAIAHNRAADAHRRKKRRPVSGFDVDDEGVSSAYAIPGRDAEPSVCAEGLEAAPLLHVAIERLSDEERRAFQLVCFEGKTYAEAGEIMGMPTGTVKTRISRGRAKLHQELAEKFGFTAA